MPWGLVFTILLLSLRGWDSLMCHEPLNWDWEWFVQTERGVSLLLGE